MKDVTIKTKAIPAQPRSKNYPTGTTVMRSSDGNTVIIPGGGSGSESVDIVKTTDVKSLTDKNVLSALRTLLEIRSRIIEKGNKDAELTDDNTLSSLRTLAEIDAAIKVVLGKIEKLYDVFLRKDIPNSADELITFIKGLVSESMISAQDGVQFGKSFASGLTGHGGLIDSLGRGELESLVLRSFLEVPELRYNRIRVTAGDLWLSPGGGLIESVEPDMDMEGNLLDTGTVTLKLESGEIGTIAVDDLCMGMYHYESGNATEDYDDGIGNRRMSGFSTCYFRITEILETATNSKFRYKLRDSSDNYPNPIAPTSMMHFVSYGNASNELRQSSIYLKGSGNPYIRILKEVNWWEFSFKNIGCQFGYLDNLKIFGVDTTGYSAFINSLYFYGKIEQLEKIVEDTLGDGDLRMELKRTGMDMIVNGHIDTVITAKILRYFKNITSEVIKWVWTRESGTEQVDIASDADWNDRNSHINTNEIHIVDGDIPETSRSVKFICEATLGSVKLREELTF
ncbi:hypothetical protein INE81_02659 [Bacteroides salyersiae]|uniref:hypothetical protein n=1 Tax=Bacteroides salyersiae TaxID=291644 RepID=UPI001B8CF3E0|nr:hypothetical protein [Bacteroides salyersiae]QUT76185.1 hypothetical protein INE81_02659 [Bacteroides salyersiae]